MQDSRIELPRVFVPLVHKEVKNCYNAKNVNYIEDRVDSSHATSLE